MYSRKSILLVKNKIILEVKKIVIWYLMYIWKSSLQLLDGKRRSWKFLPDAFTPNQSVLELDILLTY